MYIYYTFLLSKNGDLVKITNKSKNDNHHRQPYEVTSSNIDNETHLPIELKTILKKCIESTTRTEVLNCLRTLNRILKPSQEPVDPFEPERLNFYNIKNSHGDEISFSFWHPNNFRYSKHTSPIICGLFPYAPKHECTINSMISFVERYEKSLCNKVHEVTEYTSSLAGHATIYNNGKLFEETRALLTGNRKFFSNTRAWWNNDGDLFADTKALLSGKRPFFANTRAFFSKKRSDANDQQRLIDEPCPHTIKHK